MTKLAAPKDIAKSTKYTFIGTAWVAEVMGRIPIAVSPSVDAMLSDMQVPLAPVSNSAGKRLAEVVTPEGVSVPGGRIPTFISGPIL